MSFITDDTIMPVAALTTPTFWVDPGASSVATSNTVTTTSVTGGGSGIIVNPVSSNVAPLGWGGLLLILAHFL